MLLNYSTHWENRVLLFLHHYVIYWWSPKARFSHGWWNVRWCPNGRYRQRGNLQGLWLIKTFGLHRYFYLVGYHLNVIVVGDFAKLGDLPNSFCDFIIFSHVHCTFDHFINECRECVGNLDLRVQVHPGELWVSKHIFKHVLIRVRWSIFQSSKPFIACW